MACIYMSRTSVMYHKARHIDTRVYRLRELCKDGTMVLDKVSTAEQAADALTKGLPRAAFGRHRAVMLGMVKQCTEPENGEDAGEQEAFDRMYNDESVYPKENVDEFLDRMRCENILDGHRGGKRKRQGDDVCGGRQHPERRQERAQWVEWQQMMDKLQLQRPDRMIYGE